MQRISEAPSLARKRDFIKVARPTSLDRRSTSLKQACLAERIKNIGVASFIFGIAESFIDRRSNSPATGRIHYFFAGFASAGFVSAGFVSTGFEAFVSVEEVGLESLFLSFF